MLGSVLSEMVHCLKELQTKYLSNQIVGFIKVIDIFQSNDVRKCFEKLSCGNGSCSSLLIEGVDVRYRGKQREFQLLNTFDASSKVMLNRWENKMCRSTNKATIQNKAVRINKTTMPVIIKKRNEYIDIEFWKRRTRNLQQQVRRL